MFALFYVHLPLYLHLSISAFLSQIPFLLISIPIQELRFITIGIRATNYSEMAEGMRMKTIEENLRKAELQLQQLREMATSNQQIICDSLKRQEEHQRSIEEIKSNDAKFQEKTDQALEQLAKVQE